jgi:hypothetical protein
MSLRQGIVWEIDRTIKTMERHDMRLNYCVSGSTQERNNAIPVSLSRPLRHITFQPHVANSRAFPFRMSFSPNILSKSAHSICGLVPSQRVHRAAHAPAAAVQNIMGDVMGAFVPKQFLTLEAHRVDRKVSDKFTKATPLLAPPGDERAGTGPPAWGALFEVYFLTSFLTVFPSRSAT